MKRSSLRNIFLNNKTDQKKIKRLNYKTRKFLKTTKKSCLFTLDTKKLPITEHYKKGVKRGKN